MPEVPEQEVQLKADFNLFRRHVNPLGPHSPQGAAEDQMSSLQQGRHFSIPGLTLRKLKSTSPMFFLLNLNFWGHTESPWDWPSQRVMVFEI